MEHDQRREEATEITTFEPEPAERSEESPPSGRPAGKRRQRKWLPIGLFFATCASTTIAGAMLEPGQSIAGYLLNGLRYAAPVMLILLAHEMGHFLQAKRHGVPASLPYFIPLPVISPLGTLGAVIVQGGRADRRQMFDIAICGPLAGLVLALPITWYAMQHTEKVVVPDDPDQGAMVFGDPPVIEWMKVHFHGPMKKNEDVQLTPLLMAGWVGIFVTALNLIPIGQLDGGHILYCLLGKKAHGVAMGLLFGAVGWMVYTGNVAYMLLALLLIVFGPKHPPTANDRAPLGPVRVALGYATLAFIVIGFTPVPISIIAPQ